jgi:hypothetical protein
MRQPDAPSLNKASSNLLPPSLESISIPHQWKREEMEAVKRRLRAFTLELAMFGVIAENMVPEQQQMNYREAVWPLIQCLLSEP